jgi:phage gp46-like protein
MRHGVHVLRLVLDPANGEGNLSQESDGSLVDDDGLETVVTVSLFTDAQASEDLLPEGEDRRGYWADKFDDEDSVLSIGSLIWTVTEYETLTAASLGKIQQYAQDALAWMVDERAADRVECSCVRNGDDGADLVVKVYKPNQTNTPYVQTWRLYFAVH